jgi:stage II sporulation protein AA (anti-sigma F factor antagonist)
MEIAEERAGDALIVAVKGRLDATSAGEAERTILERITSGAHRLVIDLAELDYISSVGLRALLLAAKRIGSVEGRLAVCALKPEIASVFEIAGFPAILRIVATRDEALQEVS